MTSNDLGKSISLANCQSIYVSEVIKRHRQSLTSVEVSVGRTFVSIPLISSQTGQGGVRQWFKCPSCQRGVGRIIIHPITSKVGCRKCLKIKYHQQRFKNMVEEKTTNQAKEV